VGALGDGGLRMAALGPFMGCARQPCLLHGLRTALVPPWAAHGCPLVGLWGVTPMGWAEGVRLEDGPREDLVFRKIVIYLFF
jgi:hypothetical protein